MANISLKDINGNNIYPEIDTSTLSGTIEYGETGFTKGGDVYAALSGKANKDDIAQADWSETYTEDPAYIKNKPILYTTVNYDDEHYRGDAGKWPQYVYNCHEITKAEIDNKQFVVKIPLAKTGSASNITLMGDIYSIRGLPSLRGSSTAISVSSSNVASIDILLGDSNGNEINNEPIIRHIDSDELTKSDINKGYNSSLSRCRFHFTHFGSCTSTATRINTDAEYLMIKVTLTSNQTDFDTGNVFQVLVTWIEF